MARSNRYILPRQFYHITHRCHDRKFLLRFGKDRDSYRYWLREGLKRYPVSILGYCVTSNHIHLLTYSEKSGAVSRLMQFVEGTSAQAYNRRKNRQGAFWEGRYHCTLIGTGRYLWTCLAYIDLNMVRARAVSHPDQWEWCSYREILGLRRRYRIIDRDIWLKRTGVNNLADFQARYQTVLAVFMSEGENLRDPQWTESLAVGDHAFVESLKDQFSRQRIVISETDSPEGKNWSIREEAQPYG